MTSRTGKLALIVIGVIVLVIGAVFAGQGANLIPGSSMTGDHKWLYIGLVLAVVGVILIAFGARRSRRGGTTR